MDQKLCEKIYKKAHEIYGDTPPSFVSERIEQEISNIKNYNYGIIYEKALSVVEASANKGYLTQSRGCTAGLMINFLLGITAVNPLVPHYICEACNHTELHKEEFCGADLPNKYCAKCGKLMNKDGFNIPAQFCLGVDHDKVPHFCFSVAPEVEKEARDILSEQTDAQTDKKFSFSPAECIEIISDQQLSWLKEAENITGVNFSDIPLNDQKTLELFSMKNNCGVPEFDTPFVKSIITKSGIKCFDDIIRVTGLSHGTDVWDDNAEKILDSVDIKLSDVISCRDDVMIFLMKKGYQKKKAFIISEKIRIGKGLSQEEFKEMSDHGIPKWYTDSCNKIKYLFPRAHCVSQAIISFKTAYYKAHYPTQFYNS